MFLSWVASDAGLPLTGALGVSFQVIDLVGVVGNAVVGGLLARSKRMDPIGFLALAILSGLGGGLLRDTLLQQGPPVALTDYRYTLAAVIGGLVAFVVPIGGRSWRVVFPVIDALALGCWASAGALKTLSAGLGWLPALMLGTLTAVGGGALRDLTVGRVPQIMGGNTLYATCAVVASAVMVGCWYADLARVGVVSATLVGAGLCVVARWRGWQLWHGLQWHYSVARRGRLLPGLSVRVRPRRAQSSPEDR